MSETVKIRGETIDLRPLQPGFAEIMRQVCTELGLADYCPFPACRRRKRCATAQVLCYQILRQDINAMILPELLELAAGAGKADNDDNDD